MAKYNFKNISGQSLAEILIALGVGAILIGAATGAIVLSLRSSLDIRTTQVATSLNQGYLDNMKALAESDWQKIYNPPAAKGSNSQFYLAASSSANLILSGTTSTVVEGRSFTRYFSIENVNRDSCGVGSVTTNATTSCAMQSGASYVADDPSTQKITATVSWEGGRSVTETQYVSRTRNKVFVQTDWSGGSGQEGPITEANNKFATSTSINHSTTTGSIVIQGF